MSQHQRVILHVTLNTGHMAVQKQSAVNPETLQVLGSRGARLLNTKPTLHPT